MNRDEIFALERPHPNLWKLYLIRALLTGPLAILTLPMLMFRYHTLRYSFDEEGIHMRWGILFRREINLTYARIQDIHLHSGFIQRWFGLADLLVQTASGSAGPEMTIEGFKQYEALRDFLYTRMRGYKGDQTAALPASSEQAVGPVGTPLTTSDADAVTLLREIRDELRKARQAVAGSGR